VAEKKPKEGEPDQPDPREKDIQETFALDKGRGRKRGIADPNAHQRRREQIQTLSSFLLKKDTRGFLGFIGDLGIRDDSKEFAELYELWLKMTRPGAS
jgi:hypothetical protein